MCASAADAAARTQGGGPNLSVALSDTDIIGLHIEGGHRRTRGRYRTAPQAARREDEREEDTEITRGRRRMSSPAWHRWSQPERMRQ
jgi:hypothetical protein